MNARFNIILIILLIIITPLLVGVQSVAYKDVDTKPPRREVSVEKSSSHREEYKRIAQLRKVMINPRKSQNEKIQAQFDIGRLYFKTKDYQSALTEYNVLIEKLENKLTENINRFANVYYHRGLTYYKLTRYSKAVADCRMALSKKPTKRVRLRAQYILAMSYKQLSNYRVAERTFLSLLSGEPKEAKGEIVALAYLQLGHLYAQNEGYSEASNKYETAARTLSNNSDRLEAIAGSAYCYLQLKDYQSAKRLYERLVARADSSDFLATGYLALGDISALNEKWAMACQYYKAAKEHADVIKWDRTQRGEISFKLGEGLYHQGKYKNARNALNVALRLYKDAPWAIDATYRLGECYYNLKDYKNSVWAYQQAIEGYENAIEGLEGVSVQVRRRIALAYLRLAKARMHTAAGEVDVEEAMRIFQRAHSASQLINDEERRGVFSNESLYGEAECAFKLGKRDVARRAVLKLVDAAADSGNMEKLLQAGDLLFDAEDYESAAEVYEQLVYTKPVTPKQMELKAHALLQLGFCNLKRSQLEPDKAVRLQNAALRAYSILLTDDYSNLDKFVNEARYQKALIHNSLGEYEKAVVLLSTAIKSDKTGDIKNKGYLPLAHAYEKLRRYDNAIAAYEAASTGITQVQNRTFVFQRLGELCRKQGRYDAAIRYYEELAKQQNEFAAQAHYFTGWCYTNKPNPDVKKAAATYQKVIDNHPSSEFAPDAYWNLAKILSESGQQEEALALCESFTREYSSSQDAHVAEIVNAAQNFISNIRLTQTDDTSANAETYENIIASPTATSEDRAKGYLGLGNLHFQNGDVISALEDYGRAKNELQNAGDIANLQADIVYQKACAYQLLGEHEKAISAAEESLSLNPKGETKVGDYYIMGLSYETLHQLAKAKNAFESLLAQRQTSAQTTSNAYFHLGNIYAKEGQNQKALLAYQQSAQTSKSKLGKIEGYRMIARLYEPADAENAIEMWGYVISNSVEETAFQTSEALYRRGLLYVRQKDYNKAIADFEQLIEQYHGVEDDDIHKMVFDARLRLPDIIKQTGNLSLAISKAQDAESIVRAEGKLDILAQIQYQIASLYHKQAQECKPKNTTHRKLATQAKLFYKRARQNAMRKLKGELTGRFTPEMQKLVNTATFQSGQLAYQTDDFDSAISSMESFIEEFPDDEKKADAWNYLALAYYRLAEAKNNDATLFITSADAFEKAAADFPNDKRAPEWLYQAGRTLINANLFDKSLKPYLSLVDAYPEHKLAAEALYAIASELYGDKQYDAAIKSYKKLLSKYPQSDWADESAFSIGNCYYKLEQYATSIQTYQSLAKQFPDSPLAAKAQANIATHYFNNKDYAQALVEYKKLTKANFPRIETKLLASVNRSTKETENILAEPIYQKGSDKLTEAENKKISLVQRREYAKEAIDIFSSIAQKYPRSDYVAYATVSVGNAYEILEQWEDAIASYQNIAKQYGTTQQREIAKFVNYARERIKAIQNYLRQKRFNE